MTDAHDTQNPVGLLISAGGSTLEERMLLEKMLRDFDLVPFEWQTDAVSTDEYWDRNDMLFKAPACALCGLPLPGKELLRFLRDEPMTVNPLRKYLYLRLSMLPYLLGRQVMRREDGSLWVDGLLVIPLSAEGTADTLLPAGVWTEVSGGMIWRDRLRAMRSPNDMPVLAAENLLLPIVAEDARRGTGSMEHILLHWFQPGKEASCILPDGTRCTVIRDDNGYRLKTVPEKPIHVVVHCDGEDWFIA